MVKADSERVTVTNERLASALRKYEWHRLSDTEEAWDSLCTEYGYEVARLIKLVWSSRRRLALAIEDLETHFEHF